MGPDDESPQAEPGRPAEADPVVPAPRGAVFVLPVVTAGQQGPVASMLSTAGWAAAAQRVLGAAWIVTPAGIIDPAESRRRGSAPQLASRAGPRWRAAVPTVAKTGVKDVRQWSRGRRFTVSTDGPWRTTPPAFVWQRHELFHTAGLDLARDLGVPSVLFVPATIVWEARQWAVRRPWASAAERLGEQPSLRRADVVACGSEAVAEQALRLGADPERVLVTPTGVDLDLFPPSVDGSALRRRLGLEGRFAVGWVGSFRRFHALDLAVDALAGIDGATLVLIGDGPERSAIEDHARRRGVAVVATGTLAHSQLAEHLAALDVALVLAAPGAPFHYSPLKLAEYLAASCAVVAPRVAQIESRLTDGVDAILVPPGDPLALAAALRTLRDDPGCRRRLGAAARVASGEWSWDHQVERVIDALDGRAAAGPDAATSRLG